MSFSIPGYWELPPGPRLAITGGRDVHVSDADFEWLLGVFRETASVVFVLGDCPAGVDAQIKERLDADGTMPYERFIADWRRLGKRAGPERNQRMIDVSAALAAYRGWKGTPDCIRRAEAKGIPVYRRS